ncbi:hypothetical protein BDQ12DRAFT_714434 [Crucibulum laeve]|uniref:Uncharacterized protein n=1 Tax=Crucibulum laeve TaxID=68775 RepID=A0A5C3LVA3_9AGAR|nr:hypothetical protein BDQ12DRAFT_714434 [Crucibulum laeve]
MGIKAARSQWRGIVYHYQPADDDLATLFLVRFFQVSFKEPKISIKFDAMAATQLPPPIPLPNWIRTRIMNELPSDQPMPNRYEYSVYGAFNALLTTIFPAERNFSIAPQLLMRTNYDEDVRDTSASSIDVNVSFMLNEEVLAADMSTDNFGALVESRSAGAAQSAVIPDFSIVKVNANGDVKSDSIVSMLEVKKDDQKLRQSEMKMHRYLQIARAKSRPSGQIFWAFLVLGDTTQVWKLDGSGHNARTRKMRTIITDQLESLLRPIAQSNWA